MSVPGGGKRRQAHGSTALLERQEAVPFMPVHPVSEQSIIRGERRAEIVVWKTPVKAVEYARSDTMTHPPHRCLSEHAVVREKHEPEPIYATMYWGDPSF